jgi:hypothetical protein
MRLLAVIRHNGRCCARNISSSSRLFFAMRVLSEALLHGDVGVAQRETGDIRAVMLCVARYNCSEAGHPHPRLAT